MLASSVPLSLPTLPLLASLASMLNPASLFVACLITLAANPSLVSAIPLPPAAPHRTAPAVLRHRSFRSTHRLPVLRIVEDDDRAEPASSWMQAFTDESILPESIFALEEDKLLTLELAAIHRSHDVKRNLISQLASGRPLAKKATKSSKRVKRSPSEPSIRKTKHEKRFSSRWLKGQEAAKSRAAEQTSTASAIVWTKVPTSTTAAVAESTSPASTTTTSTVASSTESAVSISGTHSGDGTCQYISLDPIASARSRSRTGEN